MSSWLSKLFGTQPSGSVPQESSRGTSRFSKFIPFIIEWETVYGKGHKVLVEHDPNDPGGTTKYGIDKRSHPGVDIENLTEAGAIHLYSVEWTQAKCDSMKPGLGEAYFNAHVNCGPGRAAKLLAVSQNDAKKFIQAQRNFYEHLVAARPRFHEYLAGWENRLAALEHWLALR